jgi:hypothetical protein
MTTSLGSGSAGLAAAAMLVAASGIARADVIPPPTLVIDFFWLGESVGPIVGLVLLVGTVFLYRRLRKTGRRRLRAAAISVAVFAACNLACYVWGVSHRRPRYHPLPPHLERVDGGPG